MSESPDESITTFIFKNGDKFEGKILNGMMAGGKYTFANGNTFVGDFKENCPDNWGKFTWRNGSSYEGQFLDGRMCGDGKFVHYNNSTIISARFPDWDQILTRIISDEFYYYSVPAKFYYRFPLANN